MTAKRILWIVNIPLPAASEALGLARTPFGGWLSTMTQRLAKVSGVRLGIAMRAPVPELRSAELDGIHYFALPQTGRGGLDARPADCARVIDDFRPDLLHAEGTEMAYTRRMLEAWDGPRLLSLQGVINGYEPFELGGLRPSRLLRSLRPLQMLAALTLPLNKRLRFDPRLAGEREAISRTNHVMGRTSWDRAQAWAINPHARYHHCSRTLRNPFYRLRWCVETCERHTIFIGNAASARKGTHVALDALVLLHREFPRARLVVAGESPFDTGHSLRRWFGYPAYLMDRIRELDLQQHVEFTGLLDAQGMAERMARCHAYAMVSQIENSPNTLGEAMMLGMPCVSAFAGGAPGMAADEREALFYRPEDPTGLAYQLKRLFDSDDLCITLGAAAHARALVTHDADANLHDLLAAYSEILGGEVDA